MYLLVMGLAGSGKTTLTGAFAKWMRENGHKVRVVNLDPGAEHLPYNPDFDIRSIVTVEKLMKEHGLGPNGAMLKASEVIVENAKEILKHEAFKPFDATVIIDTPGQLEIFMLRHEGYKFTSLLKRRAPTVGVFLVDGSMVYNIADLVTSWMLGLLVQVKLDIPTIPVFSKSDLIKDRSLVEKVVEDPLSLTEDIEKSLSGVTAELAIEMARLLAEYRQSLRPVLVSAITGEGFEELFSVVHEAFCSCGDLS
ncbi:ATP-binding protein of unknown function [Pyrolobus fumarii 1A]|uniref:GTPase n=2 Tax=Pyrolobus fumarii TaxID=54252 RepID=G0EHB1_PYRF1|nr:ATP-binding protein of unknown function [Pyrolobus fumarii 1A]